MQTAHLEKLALPSKPRAVCASNKSTAVKITSAFFPENPVKQIRELSEPQPCVCSKTVPWNKTGNDGGGKAETNTGQL